MTRTVDAAKIRERMKTKETQALLANVMTPYPWLEPAGAGSVDPVWASSMLSDDLDGFLEHAKVDRDRFIADFDRARGQKGTTDDRISFRKTYGFNPLGVTFREEHFALEDAEIERAQVHVHIPQLGNDMKKAYEWFEGKMHEMIGPDGYDDNQYKELKSWYDTNKRAGKPPDVLNFNTQATKSFIYRLCLYTGRIDVSASQRMFSPRYLPNWDEVVSAFRLDLPDPEAWEPANMEEQAGLVSEYDEWNKDSTGVYRQMGRAGIITHLAGYHQSFHPLKHHCELSGGTNIFPTQEMIRALSEY
eukprot:gene28268-49585_t